MKIQWAMCVWLASGLAAAPAVYAADFESGPNVSGESTAAEHRQLFKDETIRKEDNLRIEVPVELRPDGTLKKPVRGLSSNEKREMDDLEYRYQTGQIGEAEYYSRRNAIMERLGLDPEY